MNYFEFYEIPPSFKVEKDQLRQIFLNNSKKYHPDFYTLESEAKQQEVLYLSTLNNEAYKVLSDFDARMKYLLDLKGILAAEGQNKLPQAFLMEMMEINETLMELQFDFDPSAYDEAIQNLATIEKEQYESINTIIEASAETIPNPEDLAKIKDYYLKKRYLLRIKENLDKFASL